MIMAIHLENKLCEFLNIRYPIVLAGMAGIPNMVDLVSAVSNAGGLGTLGAGYMTAEEIRSAVRKIKKQTQAPYSVNLFLNDVPDYPKDGEKVQHELNKIRERIGMPIPSIKNMDTADYFEEQLAVLLEEKVPIISTTFSTLPEMYMQQVKLADIKVMTTVTTVEEAIQAEQSGCDVIVAQGSEAGGHRGTFDISNHPTGANIGTIALIPQIVDLVQVPVVAAGGIMDGRGLVAALALGAQGVQMGTRFLTSTESGAHHVYKNALLDSTEESTVITKAFSGRPARGISNEFIKHWETIDVEPLPYPIQNTLTRDIRNTSSRLNNPEYMSLWAGQGTRMLTADQSAGEIIKQIVNEAGKILN